MSWWIEASYTRPSSLADLYPDVDFEVDPRTAYCSLTAPSKKRKLVSDSNQHQSIFDCDSYNRLLKKLKQDHRRQYIIPEHHQQNTRNHQTTEDRFEIFIIDVVESSLPKEKYPSEVLAKYKRSDQLAPGIALPIVLLFGVILKAGDDAHFPEPSKDSDIGKGNGAEDEADGGSPKSIDTTPLTDLRSGGSICVHIFDIFPYLVVECPAKFESQSAAVLQSLEAGIARDVGGLAACIQLEGESLMEYDPTHSKTFFKLIFFNSRSLNACRNLIEKQYKVNISDNTAAALSGGGGSVPVVFSQTVYECTVPYTLRWMIDTDLVGCGCVYIQNVQPAPSTHPRVSRCNYEGWCLRPSDDDIRALDLSRSEYSLIPETVRVLALDIECISSTNTFPSPTNDPVIQISIVLTTFNGEILFQAILTLDTCSALPDCHTISFSDERCMLSFWRDLVNILDPDFLTGYNFINFDLNYIIERSHKLDIISVRNFGRLLTQETLAHDAQIQSKQMGIHDYKEISLHGRIQFDLYEVIRREYKLKSYSLNNVSAHFLKQQKEDVHYSEMKSLQQGGPESRKRIALYCLKDSILVIRLIGKLSLLVNTIEMARVTGVSINLLLTRGQQIKVTSQLLRKCKLRKFFMPSIRRSGGGGDVQYEGATVLEPLRGYYRDSVVTLDFASLYPSIMIAHNMCYSTLISGSVPPSKMGLVEHDDYELSPVAKCFVKKSVKEGVLPSVVSDLLKARKRAKLDLKRCKDPFMKKVLDGRQLALKISANSVYGYTGAVNAGQLPCLAISESITSYGREMIDFTKNQVEEIFKVSNGYDHDAQVVYGDTDSVMIKFGNHLSIPAAMILGLKASKLITQKFIPPISLEFEKVFCPFLLMNKKRYAGLKWTQGCVPKELLEGDSGGGATTGPATTPPAPLGRDGYPNCAMPQLDCKGIETVRRDFCLLIQQVTDDVLNLLLLDQDVEGALNLTKETIQNLLMNKIDMSYLVMSKSIGKEDYSSKLAHIELAKKLKERDPLNAPSIGDRVYYVVIAGHKNQPQYERAEDPLYALEHNIPIDIDFYLDTLKNVLTRILEPLSVNVQSLFSTSNFSQKKMSVKTTGQSGGAGFGGLGAFVKKGIRCLLCKSVIQTGCYCKRCHQLEAEAIENGATTKEVSTVKRPILTNVHELMTNYHSKTKEHQELWTQCQSCQGSLQKDVICVNRDCPIFYRRIKVKKDLNDMLTGGVGRLKAEDSLDW